MRAETVYRFKVYGIISDDYVVSTRMATFQKIIELRAAALPETATLIDATHIDDGWTTKNFIPEPVQQPAASFQTRMT